MAIAPLVMVEASLLEAFHALLGNAGFKDDPDDLAPWLTDWRGRYTGRAAAMLLPSTTQEVSEIVRIAGENRIALVPQGGNSGMVAGATPDQSGNSVVVSLRRMNHIVSVDADNGEAVVEAGVILQNFA
jgi:FAD/FMN-containing dehydrogenase